MVQPEKIGRYAIETEIGRGGMAMVYRAHDPRFERMVALKVLPAEFLHEPNFRARFEREARTIAALEHPAVVPVYDFGEDGDFLFLVMRYMQGGSLADRLTKGPLSVEETAQIMLRIGTALDAAHSQGIIHRDLKPGNILFDQYGSAYLSDFGIARLTEAAATLTGSKASLGTPGYMSPEQIKGEKVDARSDIYALGVIVFEMLTGQRPFRAESPAMVLVKQMTAAPPHIRDIQPNLPVQYDAVLAQTMAHEPEERPSTAGDVVKMLTEASLALSAAAVSLAETTQQTAVSQQLEEVVPTIVDTPPEEMIKKNSRPKWGLWLVAALAGIVIIGGLYLAFKPGGEAPIAVETPVEEIQVNATVDTIDGGETAVDLPEIDIDAITNTLFTLLNEGNQEQVLIETEAILADNPDLAPIHAIRATALREAGDLDAALEQINQAIELDHEPANYWYESAIIHNWRGESEQSIESVNQCLERVPNDRNCLVERAYAYRSLGDEESARQDFQHVLEMNPDDWDANVELSWYYLWVEQDFERALQHINKIIELDPYAYFNYYHRGIVLREAGDIEGAVSNFRLFMDMSSPDECLECYAEAQSFLDEHAPELVNLALNKPITAAQGNPDTPSTLAIDGDFDSCWWAVDAAPQWLDIDLEQDAVVRSIQLMIAQDEPGHTIHQIQTQDVDGKFYALGFIEETTWDRKVIIVIPEEPWQGINNLRIETLESQSVPAWCEIRVFGQGN
ncbi:MAG: protein kinase [Anaerolineales bacterium]|nr:protein kinase [Anaerolineales bacterium]